MGARFPTIGEGSYKYGKGKSGIYPFMLDWNWKYHYELIFITYLYLSSVH